MNRVDGFLWLLNWTVIVGSLCLGAACQSLAEPDPPAQEMLLTLEELPTSWEFSGLPAPMGPDTSIGFGDENDSYVSFKLKNDKYNIAGHYVFYYPSTEKGEAGYRDLSRRNFNDNSIAVNKPWETPAELPYTSSHADQFRMACTINNIAGANQVCQMIAQYGHYVTMFHAVIMPDTISLSEFNDVVRVMDDKMREALARNEN